jgi:A/G-specific adenine glycosylase
VHPDEKTIILKKRNEKDIWENLYEFPLIETSSEASTESLLMEPEFKEWFGDGASVRTSGNIFKHQLSHQSIMARFYMIDVNKSKLKIHPDWEKISLEKLDKYPISRLMERFFEDEN